MANPRSTRAQDVPDPDIAPPEIPAHELLRRIGRGSYGEVWLARSAQGDYRAVKVVYRRSFDNERPYERELSGIQRFEPVSRSHASQINILQVGRDDAAGCFYYIMELADDANAPAPTPPPPGAPPAPPPPLNPDTYEPKTIRSELARHHRLPFEECLRLSLALTTALDHLHSNGLIHRDIKPANVIFVRGVPKLADIGLVTDVGGSISFVGTEGFLPPEGPGTTQADIYSLGKVLYEISTGRDRLDFPELPTFFDDSDPDRGGLLELNLVFLKACQNDPRRRYQSAREMAADLAVLQSGGSLMRNRAAASRRRGVRRLAAAAILVALLALLAQQWAQRERTRSLARQNAELEQREQYAEERYREKHQALVHVLAANASRAAGLGDYPLALLWAANALERDARDLTNQPLHLRLVRAFARECPRTLALLAPASPVDFLAFSPEGRRLAAVSGGREVHIWDAFTGDPMFPPLLHSNPIVALAFSPDGRRLAVATTQGQAWRWNLLTGEPVPAPLNHGPGLNLVAFLAGGRQILTAGTGSRLLIWDHQSGRQSAVLTHEQPVTLAAASPDGRQIATATAGRQLQLWDASTGEAIGLPFRLETAPRQLQFAPDGRQLLVRAERQARLFSLRPLEPVPGILAHEDAILTGGFTPDQRAVWTIGADLTVQFWDTRAGTRRDLWRVPERSDLAVISPDQRWLLVAHDQSVTAWSTRSRQPEGPPWFFPTSVRAVLTAPGADRFAVLTADGAVQVIEPGAYPGLEELPVESWGRFARFVSGRGIDPAGGMAPLSPDLRAAAFRQLRARHPGLFAPAGRAEWHRRAAEDCEQREEWFGAQFHWDRVLTESPRHTEARARRQAAKEKRDAQRAPAVSRPSTRPPRFPPRAPETPARLIDLSPFYNAALTESWIPGRTVLAGNDLASLPGGVQKLHGVEFDLRGLIQLSGSALESAEAAFPKQVTGLPLNQKCRRLHFLHGAVWSAPFRTMVGRYQIHFADGRTREIRLSFGENIQDWWFAPGQSRLTTGAAVAWEGSNPASRDVGMALRLYHMAWQNPSPESEIRSIDFVSSMERPAPFLLAITAE